MCRWRRPGGRWRNSPTPALVRAIGLSNYSIEDVERCHTQRPVDAVELAIAVTIFEPLASGILSGKTLEQVRAVWSGKWQETDWYKQELGSNAEQNFAVLDRLRPIADRVDATVAQVAIAWALHQKGVTAAIADSRDGKHMQENAAAVALDLSEVLTEIEELIPRRPTPA